MQTICTGSKKVWCKCRETGHKKDYSARTINLFSEAYLNESSQRDQSEGAVRHAKPIGNVIVLTEQSHLNH